MGGAMILRVARKIINRALLAKRNQEKIEKLEKEIDELKQAVGITVTVSADAHKRINKLKQEVSLIDKVMGGVMKYFSIYTASSDDEEKLN